MRLPSHNLKVIGLYAIPATIFFNDLSRSTVERQVFSLKVEIKYPNFPLY